MLTCPSCGRQNPDGARFCNACAAPLAGDAAVSREERKVVTVLFADLVGFTARAERLDPEDVRALLAPYHARLRSELERFGGTVEKFIGDAVMALFGAPVAHEDDPERALRAAFAIRDWVLEDNELQLRIAVNTGEALIALDARPAAGEGMASGDIVNSTARLQAAAPVNGILVGETTYRATQQLIDYREAEAVEAKGKAERIRAWEAIAPREQVGVDVVQSARTPLIGREQELSLMLAAAQRVRDEREPQLVTLVGVPGIGKSRLTFELFQAVEADDSVVWRQGRCLPYGEAVSFWAIGEIVKSHAQISESEGRERAEQKLRRAIAAAVPDGEEAEWLARHLRPLVGIGADESPLTHDSRADAFAAWRRFFEALADQHPLVLVIEDLHWADDQLLDFVDHLVDWASDVPLLVVSTARPELLERRPAWGGGKANATTLSLRPLSDDETARLLAANLARPVLEAELQGALLERAGGNPLYAEQYARMLVEREHADELSVPETLQAIVAARLDGLSAEDKGLLQNGAVHGKVFWSGAVAAMAGGDRAAVEERLHGLERKEFVRRQRRSAVAGDAEYAFRHMLVRDVAYGQIPRRARADKHRQAAEWIDALAEGRDDHVELLADHYRHALDLVRAAGGDEAPIAERARFAFRDAAERAFVLGAFGAATRLYRQALELWAPVDAERPALLLGLAESRYWAEEEGAEEAVEARDALLALGDAEKAAHAEAVLSDVAAARGDGSATSAHAERALELTRGLPPSRATAYVLFRAAMVHLVTGGQPELALAEAEELLRIAEEIGAEDSRVAALSLRGLARTELGDLRGIDDAERAFALAHELRLPEAPLLGGGVAVTCFDLGELPRAFELVARARQDATRLGNRPMLDYLDVLRLRELYWQGHWDEAARLADERVGREQRGPVRLLTVRSQIRLARGFCREALADTADALEGGRASVEPQQLHAALAAHARASLAAGARSAGLAAVDELLDRFVAEGTQQLSGTLPDLAVTAVDLGRADAFCRAIGTLKKQTPWVAAARSFAEGDFVSAAAVYTEIGSRPDAAYAHLRAARALVEQGRVAEADPPLREALAFYRSVGATYYLREGEALLAATA